MICKLVLLALLLFDFTLECVKHGESTVKEYNGFVALLSALIMLGLFYGAGMFDNFNL